MIFKQYMHIYYASVDSTALEWNALGNYTNIIII